MRGTAISGPIKEPELLAALGLWLGRLMAGIPHPEGDHGDLTFTVTVEWDYVKAGP